MGAKTRIVAYFSTMRGCFWSDDGCRCPCLVKQICVMHQSSLEVRWSRPVAVVTVASVHLVRSMEGMASTTLSVVVAVGVGVGLTREK